MAGIVERNRLWIISDEIHCDLTQKRSATYPYGKGDGGLQKLVTCMAASKTFNLAGTLFSNIIIRDEALREDLRKEHKLGGWSTLCHWKPVKPLMRRADRGLRSCEDIWMRISLSLWTS